MLKNYFQDLMKLLLQPILFFTRMPDSEWWDKPVTFLGITAMILAFFTAFSVFITQYIPIGSTLFEKVSGLKIIIVSPVMLVLAFMFSVIAFSILFVSFLAGMLLLFWMLGALIFWGGNILKGKGDYLKDVKASFYSSGIFLALIIPVFMLVLLKNKTMDFTNFAIGYNIFYGFAILFLYGLQAIIARKVHGLKKWKAFIVALLPFLVLIMLGVIVSYLILPKISPWIS